MELYLPCDLHGLGKHALLNCIPDHGHKHSNGNQSWGTGLEHIRGFRTMSEMIKWFVL